MRIPILRTIIFQFLLAVATTTIGWNGSAASHGSLVADRPWYRGSKILCPLVYRGYRLARRFWWETRITFRMGLSPVAYHRRVPHLLHSLTHQIPISPSALPGHGGCAVLASVPSGVSYELSPCAVEDQCFVATTVFVHASSIFFWGDSSVTHNLSR